MIPGAKRSTPPKGRAPAFVPPYAPSWIDRIFDWVDRLPIPWWLFYVLLALPINGAVAIVLWQTGIYAAVGFHPMQVFLPSLPVYFLALTHGLDHVAASAMTRFRPAFRGDDEAFAAAVYRMTTLPARTALVFPVVAGLVSVPFGRIEMASLQMGGLDHVPVLFLSVLGYFYTVAYVFFYHTLHQLREIHRLHRDHAEVRLGRVGPLYSLSRVTSLTALGLVLNNYGWFVAQPGGNPNNTVTLLEGGTNLLIALIVFVWPLWGAHRLLTEAKEKGLSEVALRKEGARAQLHDAVDKGQLVKVDPLHKALEALSAESAELAKIATWPWAPGTLRNLLGAVLLPMALWLVQFGLGRLLG
jgi:hypothetical protein